ncbi:hypothetical protein QQP08_021543 [Theobroma cacao]|nr:hypothetical protein QQP08_021543 [Theobroma cacao]
MRNPKFGLLITLLVPILRVDKPVLQWWVVILGSGASNHGVFSVNEHSRIAWVMQNILKQFVTKTDETYKQIMSKCCGFRQADPISPSLFVTAIECLSPRG